MKLELLKPAKSLSKAYLKQDLKRNQIELFKTNLNILFSRANEADKKKESEEHFKNLVADFLKDTFYKTQNEINTSGRNDLVIHNGKTSSNTVGVIIEAKQPYNHNEMISPGKPNSKALHQLLHYYMQERYIKDNKEIKHLIATNIYEWFVFDGAEFEKFFFENPKLRKQYKEWNDGLFGLNKTDWFYQEVAKPFIEKELEELTCTYFNLKEVEKVIQKKELKEDKRLIDLYKILSPEHLLKKPFANDSNTLNKDFYHELLHIIGLSETNDKGKKIIKRKSEAEQDERSLLENTINILRLRNKLAAFENAKQFGETEDAQLFSIALELCITWLNRILFLKLLEGQLIKYHKGDRTFSFLNFNLITDFDEVNELFFEVLAVPTSKRAKSVKDKFGSLPYLNSSLFEESKLEIKTLVIADLKDRLEIPILPATVLKEANGKKISGKKNTLQYLFEFLDAYDFASDSSAEIQEQNKTIINASVLGLIFEKINGYKDGSFFTPGFITMYMCRETIRKAVIQKFNIQHKWTCSNFNELYNKLEKVSNEDANNTINNLKICDPAVGSGHFLVSALNEIISIKNDLGILVDKEGRRLKGYSILIENDELIITHEDEIFQYNYRDKESQRIQETLFHEKQTLIENCLLGVDINPKSVMICRLRLWIELLKNSYYTKESDYNELETLPNIDINIKCGNSLISRFAIDADLSKALKSIKYNIEQYRGFVADYKNEKNREVKRGLQKIIDIIKADFVTQIRMSDPRKKRLDKLLGELYHRFTGNMLFEDQAPYGKGKKTEPGKDREKLETEIEKISKDLEAVKNNAIYKNAFEWRFEFPEVLNNNGDFEGFDVVIGNPPYGVKANEFEKEYYSTRFKATDDIYTSFIELGNQVTSKSSNINFIIPITWLTGPKYINTRRLFTNENSLAKAVNLPYDIFADAFVDTGIYFFERKSLDESLVFEFNPKEKVTTEDLQKIEFKKLLRSSWTGKADLKINLNEADSSIFSKLDSIETKLSDISETARGILADKNDYQANENKDLKKVFTGNLNRYTLDKIFSFIRYDENLKEKPKSYDYFIGERILVRRIISRQFRIMATFTKDEFICKKDIYIIKLNDKTFDCKYVLALLNSKLISFYKTKNSGSAKKDDFTQITLNDIRQLPIPKIDLREQQPFIKLVDKILEKKKTDVTVDTRDLEDEIDKMIYQLYNITEEEQKIIEEA